MYMKLSKSISLQSLLGFFHFTCPALFFLVLSGCEDEPVARDYPRIRTMEVTNITENGVKFSAEVYEKGNVPITEHGFTWSFVKPQVTNSERVLLGSFEGPGLFSADVTTALESGLSYKVCAFVKAGDYTVYGNEITFTSLGSEGPVLTGFEPPVVMLGDTVFFKGRNFSWILNNAYIDNIQATSYPVSDSVLKVIVPYYLTKRENIIAVEVTGNRATYTDEKLVVMLPEIASFQPSSGYWGDTVTIELLNVMKDTRLGVSIGSVPVTPVEPFDGSRIRVLVPGSLVSTQSDIVVTVQEQTLISASKFELLPPAIDSISPLSGDNSTIITLYGHLNPTLAGSTIAIGTVPALIQSLTKDSIKFKIYSQSSFTGNVVYKSYSYECVSDQQFTYNYVSEWTTLPALPFTSSYGLSMKFGNEVIVANGSTINKSLYIFDPASGTFTQLSNETYAFPSLWPSVVVKGNKAYMLGYIDSRVNFYSFDYGTLTIEKVSDYPGRAFGDQVLFDGDSVLYMGGGWTSASGFNKEFYKYSLSSGKWTRLGNLPGNTCHTNEFTVNGRFYAVFYDKSTYEYNPVNDTWLRRAQYPGYWCRFKVDVECGGEIYMGYGDASDKTLKKYAPGTDQWIDLGYTFIPNKSFYLNFSIDDKVYIGGGVSNLNMYMLDTNFSL
jgi:hypothetical protein